LESTGLLVLTFKGLKLVNSIELSLVLSKLYSVFIQQGPLLNAKA